MRKKVFVIFLLVVTAAGILFLRAGNRNHEEKQTRFVMDTYVSIIAVGPKKITVPAINAALDRIQEIDVKFNHLNPESPLYAFNQKGAPLTEPEILTLIKKGLEVSRKTDGAFDMTVTPLLELWGFYTQKYRIPAPQEIKECLRKVGYRHLLLKDKSLTKDTAGVKIDLGGIAKGYAIAEALKVLQAQGITSAIIDAGGDIYALGRKSKNHLWRIGIRNPRGEEGSSSEDIIGYLEAENLSVMGSGDYERFFIKDGVRYCHIFNSKTGYPVQGMAGVTIVYDDPVAAQIWAKIPFVVGAQKGLEIIKNTMPGMGVIIVSTNGEIISSDNLKDIIKTIGKNK